MVYAWVYVCGCAPMVGWVGVVRLSGFVRGYWWVRDRLGVCVCVWMGLGMSVRFRGCECGCENVVEMGGLHGMCEFLGASSFGNI